ncbi:hypothetical protein KSP40_PGU012777 [Platanthera guangdongensis]|uniref:KIB1-4 beta-propeller domain-containing protein n=1 Tax=Platanthera guangdongensis TaxID=2320717 RepID=A0ABR2LVX6_9ASPA
MAEYIAWGFASVGSAVAPWKCRGRGTVAPSLDKDTCLFYQCNDRRSCRVNLPGLRGAKCCVSKHDFINFRGVCLHWRSASSCRSNITELSKKDPWCIFYDFDAPDKDMCLFCQCNDRRSCLVKLPGLRGAKCFVSKHGWLFIHRNNDYLFFNPLTLEEKFLPKLPASFQSSPCQVGTFSASPSSKECIAISTDQISTFQNHSPDRFLYAGG